MTRCPGCGAEVDAHMTQCWECHEAIGSGNTNPDDDEFDDDEDLLELEDDGLDDDLGDEDLDLSPQRAPARKKATTPRGDLEDAADALLAQDEPHEDDSALRVPESAVVAYVAQDEVQAGAISQLLSDCGIRNFATSGSEEDEVDSTEATLQVQVLKEDLAAAQRVIEEFTSEFDDFSG